MSSFSSPPSAVVRTEPHNQWCQSIFEAVEFIWIKEIGWVFFKAQSLVADCRFFNYRKRDWQDSWRKSLHHQPNTGTGFSGVSNNHRNSSVHTGDFSKCVHYFMTIGLIQCFKWKKDSLFCLQFQRVNQSTEKLTCGLTALKEKCLQFSKTAQSLSAARRLTSLALSRHTQLLEILELPQLMDTCVRNGYWEEALDLAAYVARLERKLGYIPLIVVCFTFEC